MTTFTDKAVALGGKVKGNWKWLRWILCIVAAFALFSLARCM